MKYLFVLFFSLVWFSSNAQLLKTKLEITVRNTSGNLEAGVAVKIFGNEDDYLEGKNEVGGVQYTDSKGKVIFKELEEKSYYINAEKGKADNYGESEKTIPLKAGAKNRVTIIITEGN